MDRGAWPGTVYEVAKESNITCQLNNNNNNFIKKFKVMFGTVNGWLDTVRNNEEIRVWENLLNTKENLKGKWQEMDEGVWEIDLGDQTMHSKNSWKRQQ